MFREGEDSNDGEPLYTLVVDGIKKGEHLTMTDVSKVLASYGESGNE